MSLSIVFTKRAFDWHACVEGVPATWGCGRSPAEALGELVRTDPGILGRIEVLWPGATATLPEAAAVTTTIQSRISYQYYETVSSGGGSCPMCSTTMRPRVPHACTKPDFDQPAHEVPARGTTLLYSPGGHHA